ncbi:hypothetical protein BIW11_14113 [Tropilaelaps mercedesae]|uniref:Uncharacterized protein n=1 Tax=Tropilaelaps mercedesae TaxID=418985 RepID=A0A1V9WZA1_9ACAR|nr:hypothetical protein BIW11_14113 [Tropilaelaps mercedesae]
MPPTGADTVGPAYRLYFDDEEAKSKPNGAAGTGENVGSKGFLDLVEKRSKMVARARSHGQPQKYVTLRNEDDAGSDEEETVFYENNNMRSGICSDEVVDAEGEYGRLGHSSGGLAPAEAPKNRLPPEKTATLTFRRHVLPICLMCLTFVGFYAALHLGSSGRRAASGLPSHFNISYRIVIEGLQINTNLATLPLANHTRAVFFSAYNTIVCARIDVNELIWKRTLIHKVDYVQCNEAACVFYGNNTVTALEPSTGGFLWTSRVKARPFLMTTSWGNRIVVFHNEYMLIYRQVCGQMVNAVVA